MKMNIGKLLSELTAVYGPPGNEGAVHEVIKKYLPDAAIRTDNMGNLLATIRPAGEGEPLVVLDAHTDEISLLVTDVQSDGILSVCAVGGVDHRVTYGAAVVVLTSKGPVDGVVITEDVKSENMQVDIGFSKEESPARQGNRACFKGEAFEMPNGRLCAKSMDNRAGVAAVLTAAELLADSTGCGLSLLFASQEEVGIRGAAAGAFNLKPDYCLSVDVSFGRVGDQPVWQTGEVGKGAMIGFSPVLDIKICDTLLRLAQEQNIPYQKEIMAGSTGTDADRISMAAGGVRTGLVSIPLWNMHTPVEILAVEDVESTARLLAAFVKEMGGIDHD